MLLTADAMEGFVRQFLLPGYLNAVPIAPHMRAWWKLCCSNYQKVAIASPREHTKTTSINHGFGLAGALFQVFPYQLKVCRTLDLAQEKVQHARDEIESNRRLAGIFKLRRFVMDTVLDFICEGEVDGRPYRFRIAGTAPGKSVRGMSWGTRRPDLLIFDDIEDEEEVMNGDRREALKRWFQNVMMPIGHRDTVYRVIGTILHSDSLLSNLLENPEWKSIRQEACDAEVSEGSILWPEMFPRERLLAKKRDYVALGNLAGFNMEYRNVALDLASGFFRPEDFVGMGEEDEEKVKAGRLKYYVGIDFAISTAERRDRTVFVVGGLDEDGVLHVVDVRAGRWDAQEILEEWFSIEEAWEPEAYYAESGSILKALAGALEAEQRERGVFLSIEPMVPTKDKSARARSFQARCRSRSVRFDRNASWFADYEEELLSFPRGVHDDHVDGSAWLGIGLSTMVRPLTEREEYREQLSFARRQSRAKQGDPYEMLTGYEYHRGLLQ
jgi:predicted phage terminase large subunit-like protein